MDKLLVALDGSKRQQGVLDAAVGLARMTHAKLVLFRAVGIPHDLPPRALTLAPNDVIAFLEERAKADLEALASGVDPDLLAGTRVDVGTPWPSIERAAQDEKVDLIVIGSHGYGPIDRLLGTTAAKVVNHADRSVLVVRSADRPLH